MARMVGINHVVLEVDDLEEALDFYGRLFELELRGRVPGMAFLDMGDQFLVLAEGRSQPPDGERHFGLVVDDRQDVRRKLEEAGARSSAAGASISATRGGTTCRSCSTRTSSSRRRPRCLRGWAWTALRRRPRRSTSCAEKGLL